MIQAVEESRDIQVDDPASSHLHQPLPQDFDRIVRRSTGPKPVRAVTEVLLVHRLDVVLVVVGHGTQVVRYEPFNDRMVLVVPEGHGWVASGEGGDAMSAVATSVESSTRKRPFSSDTIHRRSGDSPAPPAATPDPLGSRTAARDGSSSIVRQRRPIEHSAGQRVNRPRVARVEDLVGLHVSTLRPADDCRVGANVAETCHAHRMPDRGSGSQRADDRGLGILSDPWPGWRNW